MSYTPGLYRDNRDTAPPNGTHLVSFVSVYWRTLASLSGESGAERLAGDLSVRRRPGCDTGGGNQRWTGYHGEGGQILPETGEGEPDGGVEVLHLLRVPGVPVIDTGWR